MSKIISGPRKFKIDGLKSRGYTIKEISIVMDCSYSTIYFYFNPDKVNSKKIDREKYKESDRLRQQKYRDEKKKRKEAKIKRNDT